MILAGDVGATKCNLALLERRAGLLEVLFRYRFPSADYPRLEDILSAFLLRAEAEVQGIRGKKIDAAGFGVAGPVIDNRVHATNLPWTVDGASAARSLGLKRVTLLNDLEATGYSLDHLQPSEICTLNEGTPVPKATMALIAAGTGLGEAILFWDRDRYAVIPTEGGHTDLAPRTEKEIELLRFLKRRYQHVSFELVLSGRGFRTIHEFLDPARTHPGFEDSGLDPAPIITGQALAATCPICVETLGIWTALYGAEAGNLALKALARGGVYVAGGIAVKILPKMKDGAFVRAFCEKSKFGPLLSQIPIRLVLNQEAPLLGAAAQAEKTLGG